MGTLQVPGARRGTGALEHGGCMSTTESTAAAATVSTRNTGRRIVQYILDVLLAGIVLSILGGLLNLVFPEAGFRQITQGWTSVSGLESTTSATPSITAVALTFLVWASIFIVVPILRDRTPAMMLLGLRIVRIDGTSPSAGQHIGRALLLVVDTLFGGLVGWIVMLCSQRRQRIGDHAAGTLVVRA